MKKFYILFIAIVLPLVGFSQSEINIESEEAAIKAVIEQESNAYLKIDYEGWKDAYVQNDPFVRLNSGANGYGGANDWQRYDSTLNAFYISNPDILIAKYEFKDYIIRIGTPESAWASYFQYAFDSDGTQLGWSIQTRFLEKQNEEWKISYMSQIGAGSYELNAIPSDAAITADGSFTVPSLTHAQKVQRANMLCYNNIIAGIDFAKSQGVSIEEYAKYQGERWKDAWDPAVGFEGIVDFIITSNIAWAENVEILNQSDNSITIRVSQLYPELIEMGDLLGVTHDELMVWLKEMMIPICEYLGCSFSLEPVDEGNEITLERI